MISIHRFGPVAALVCFFGNDAEGAMRIPRAVAACDEALLAALARWDLRRGPGSTVPFDLGQRVLLSTGIVGVVSAVIGGTMRHAPAEDWTLAGIVCAADILVHRRIAPHRAIALGRWRRDLACAYRPARILAVCLSIVQTARALATAQRPDWPADMIAAAVNALAIDLYLVSCAAHERIGARASRPRRLRPQVRGRRPAGCAQTE